MLLMIDNAISIGLQTLGLGMGIVISMLVILALVLYTVIPIFRKISNRKTDKKSTKKSPGTENSQHAVQVPSPENEDDAEIVAVIIAAIAASEGKAPEGFRVVSFKRI